jgi:hypothetical protein
MWKQLARRALALTVCLVVVGLLRPALAEEFKPVTLADTDGAAIRMIIERQVAAFRADDAVAAFALATPGIRAKFRSPERFMALVKLGYQPVYRPRQFEFEATVEVHGRLAQRVHVVDADGTPLVAFYFMARQADGGWLIDDCMLVAMPERGA